MERGSTKHGAMQDDALKKEVEPIIRSNAGPAHAEEWRDPEPPAEDDPILTDPLAARLAQQPETD